MATPDQIQSDARRKYNAVGDTFFVDDDFYDLIYEAETILAEEAMVIQNIYTATSVADQREYAWPTTAMAIKRIEFDGNKLRYMTFREDDAFTISQADTTESGTPDYYSLWDRTIFLRPIPSTASLTIKIYTYDRPTLLSSGSSNLATPEYFRKDIVTFCVANMAMKDGNEAVANMYFQKWERAVKAAIRWQKKRLGADGPKVVKNVDCLPSTYLGVT
jgi:hypothetical protein